MLQREVFPYYRQCVSEMEKIYRVIRSYYDVDKSVSELCKFRGYVEGGEQYKLLKEMQICACGIDDVKALGENAVALGLVGRGSGMFLLEERFIIPVRDIAGGLISLVGYYPDYKKYITVPTPFFSKDAMFFNIDHAFRLSWEQYDGIVFLVEGMFDCLSLRSIGLPAIATMGSTVTDTKKEILKQFKKVVYIPDADNIGKRALNRYNRKHGWRVPESAVGLQISGSVELGDNTFKIKDIDNLVSWFEPDDVRELLLGYADSNELIERVVL